MYIVLLTALGVGGATVLGAVLGFIFKSISHRFSDIILSFAAGVMLASAVLGLIVPSLEKGGKYGILNTIVGIFVGCLCVNLADKLMGRLRNFCDDADGERTRRILLFVAAIAIHNLPEGIAAGVGFGGGDITDALLIAGGIALQNVPEGMVIIGPMLCAGIKPRRTFLLALLTGLIEVVGTFIGYYAIRVSSVILPFALAFAGGTMLYIINDEIIPETHRGSSTVGPTYSLLAGFSLILLFDALL